MPINKFGKCLPSSDCIKNGLGAIQKKDKKHILLKNSKSNGYVSGSVDLDSCYLKECPEANRWDYIIFLNHKLYAPCQCIEIHSCNSSEVSVMKRKLQWLKDLLIKNELGNIKKDYRFIWVYTNGDKIPKGSHYSLQRAKLGIELMNKHIVI